MGIGALAGAIGGAGTGIRQNREAALARDEYDIRREEADRKQQSYEQEQAFREIMASRPDPNQIAQQIAQGPQQALPADQMGPPAAAAPPPRYREAYDQWKDSSDALAMKAGGLEGYQKFQEMENATSRRMVMGYGLEAIRSMDEGDLGTAVKAANTALETTPFNTGMKFVPRNGKLYLEGADGDLGGPYDADALRVFVEDNMKTPEAYLDWKGQYEKERAALVREGQGQQQVEAYATDVKTRAGKAPSEILLNKARAYQALASGQAALTPKGGDEEGLAWNENNILKIEDMEKEAMEGGLGFGGLWGKEGMASSELHSATVGAAKEIRVANAPNAMSHNDAAELARMAYFHQLEPGEKDRPVPPNLGSTRVFTDDQGNYMVQYKGKSLLVPPVVGQNILSNKQFQEE